MNTIELTPMNLLHNALCTGVTEMSYADCGLSYSNDEYNQAKQAILDETKADGVCREEVWIKMLNLGFTITISDDMNFPKLTKESIEKNFEELYMSMNPTFLKLLVAFIQGDDDSVTAWDFIQLMAYKEVVFG